MNDDEIYIGRTPTGALTAGSQRSVLVLGPSRSGKTSSLVIPNILMSNRAVITTSTKDDVLRYVATAHDHHRTLLFDPSGEIPTPLGVTRIGFSPLAVARKWDRSLLATRSLLDVRRRNLEVGDDHWSERATALVAPLFHAAALRGDSIATLSAQVDHREAGVALRELSERYGANHPSATMLSSILSTSERELSSIWSTASGLFAGLRSDAARQASREGGLDIKEFLRGRHHLHIVSPSRHQAMAAPLIVGLIDEIVDATYRQHREVPGLLLALDELANVAPLPRLASIVSEGGGQGVLTMACLQDLSQARARWPTTSDGFLSLFANTIVLPGVADRRTLELISSLAGDETIERTSTQRNRRGRSVGSNSSWDDRPRLPLDVIARGRTGYALGLSTRKEVEWVPLTSAYNDPRFRHYLERSRSTESRERSL